MYIMQNESLRSSPGFGCVSGWEGMALVSKVLRGLRRTPVLRHVPAITSRDRFPDNTRRDDEAASIPNIESAHTDSDNEPPVDFIRSGKRVFSVIFLKKKKNFKGGAKKVKETLNPKSKSINFSGM